MTFNRTSETTECGPCSYIAKYNTTVVQYSFARQCILTLVLLEIFSVKLLVATYHPVTTYSILLVAQLLGVPHILLIFYVFYELAERAGITHYLKKKGKRCVLTIIRGISQAEVDGETESVTDSLLDRLINPGEYEPVLRTYHKRTHCHGKQRTNQ